MNEPFESQALRKYAFALVDPGMTEQLPDGLPVERLVPRNLRPCVHLMPLLIDLGRLTEDQLDILSCRIQHVTEDAQTPTVALFIKTKANMPEVARHWNAMQLVQPQPGRKLWLRLHDPRVLHQMLRILTPMQRRKLFGVALAFTYWIGGEWVTVERDSINHASNRTHANGGVEPYAGPENWNWSRIERIGLINRALHAAGIWSGTMLSSSGALAEQLMDRAAERHGLIDHMDLIEFAARGLMSCPTFDEHPVVARVITPNATSPEQSRLSDRLALIAEHVWNELRQPGKMPQERQL